MILGKLWFFKISVYLIVTVLCVNLLHTVIFNSYSGAIYGVLNLATEDIYKENLQC